MGTLEQERQQRIQVAGDILNRWYLLTSSFYTLFLSLSLSTPIHPFFIPFVSHPFVPPLPPFPPSLFSPPPLLPQLFSSPPSPFLPPSFLIKTHYNFLEHRERICHEVNTIAATNCVFEPPKDLQLPRKMKKPHSGGTPMGTSLPGKLPYNGKFLREKTFANW